MNTIVVAAALIAGAITWTFLEYVIHRWLGHHPRTRPNPFAVEHVRHHSEGNYFAAVSKKILAAIIVAAVLLGPSVWLVGWEMGPAYVLGFLAMYAAYETLHRREHTHPGINAYFRALRRHHFHHHFVDPSSNHGVTTRFWDRVFGTYQEPDIIRVPQRLAMPWLLDPDTGDVRSAFQAHYVLRRLHA